MANEISIVDDDAGLVLQEKKIEVTDEKLTSILKSLYETARTDASKFRLGNYWQAVCSVAVTLLFTLLQSDLKDLVNPFTGTIICDAQRLTRYAWECDSVLFVLGLVLMALRFSRKNITEYRERDQAVKVITDRCFGKVGPQQGILERLFGFFGSIRMDLRCL